MNICLCLMNCLLCVRQLLSVLVMIYNFELLCGFIFICCFGMFGCSLLMWCVSELSGCIRWFMLKDVMSMVIMIIIMLVSIIQCVVNCFSLWKLLMFSISVRWFRWGVLCIIIVFCWLLIMILLCRFGCSVCRFFGVLLVLLMQNRCRVFEFCQWQCGLCLMWLMMLFSLELSSVCYVECLVCLCMQLFMLNIVSEISVRYFSSYYIMCWCNGVGWCVVLCYFIVVFCGVDVELIVYVWQGVDQFLLEWIVDVVVQFVDV